MKMGVVAGGGVAHNILWNLTHFLGSTQRKLHLLCGLCELCGCQPSNRGFFSRPLRAQGLRLSPQPSALSPQPSALIRSPRSAELDAIRTVFEPLTIGGMTRAALLAESGC